MPCSQLSARWLQPACRGALVMARALRVPTCHGARHLASSFCPDLTVPSVTCVLSSGSRDVQWLNTTGAQQVNPPGGAYGPGAMRGLCAVTLPLLPPQVPGPRRLGPRLLPQKGEWRGVLTEAGVRPLRAFMCLGSGWHLPATGCGEPREGWARWPKGREIRQPSPAQC